MKKLFLSLAVLFLFVMGLHAQQLPQITIVNNTGYTIFFVYFSSTADDSWGPDRLGATQTIGNRQSVTLRLPYQLNVVNRYDIMLVDSDGDSYTKMNVAVSNNARIVFTFDDIDF